MIETTLKWFAVTVCCLILQTSLVSSISIFSIKPDLLIIVLFFMCIKHGVMPGIYVGFILGLGLDVFTPDHLGQNALAKTITGFFIGFFNEKIMRIDPFFKIIILLISFIIHDTIFLGIDLLKNNNSLTLLLPALITRTFPRAIYSIVVVFLIYIWDSIIKPNIKP